ncbi:penicillin-binding transpeptidase domain-containing protein [Streptomyces sp. E1N211]|uniref:penicillin-binding transpeptidase domain-containing protein n=1 Tax=Streptomyces sp. E1N211 TaxID=1851876 RepID=UPI001F4EE5D0|nr:penicillin-binding transpeptidase domain-containing protein [Streptomyces sp. E1N211]
MPILTLGAQAYAAIGTGASYNIVSAIGGGGGGGGSSAADTPRSGPPGKDEVRETTDAFFGAWEKGRAAEAASYTNNAQDAGALLAAYGEEARIGRVDITPGAPRGATVPFTVKATVSADGASKPLRYTSTLTVVRGQTTGRALVDWEPSVVHPDLKDGDSLVTGESAQPPIEAVDRDGTVLTREKYPSLGPVLDTLRQKYGDKAGGSPAVELSIRHATDEADTPLLTLAEGEPGKLRTTLSAGVQAAAEKAVKDFPESSVVALKPSTGEVLAVANNRGDGFNAAFQGQVAPGSTMKIITAAMLIDNGVTSMNGPAPCTDTAVWKSQTFKNLTGMEPNEGATLANSFLRSCNTAFIKLIDEEPVDDASLTREAQERFGLGRDDWKTGIASFDGSVPASGGPDRAANAIGQGQVQMNPLNMAAGRAGYLVRWRVTTAKGPGGYVQSLVFPSSVGTESPVLVRFVFEAGPDGPPVADMDRITRGIRSTADQTSGGGVGSSIGPTG